MCKCEADGIEEAQLPAHAHSELQHYWSHFEPPEELRQP